jgi:Domain of unknown function (DUF4386)
MRSDRKTATLVGVLFIVGDIAGVLSVVLMGRILDDPGALAKIATSHDRLVAGALLILVLGFTLAMIPILLYPIFRRYDEALALACVVFRGAIETVTYIVSAIVVLTIAELGQEYAGGSVSGPAPQTLVVLLRAVQNSIAADVISIVFSIGAAIFYYLFYRSRLIPRWLSIWGLVGAALYLAAPLLDLFGSPFGVLMAPLALQELVLAVFLIVRGFDTSPGVTSELEEVQPAGASAATTS